MKILREIIAMKKKLKLKDKIKWVSFDLNFHAKTWFQKIPIWIFAPKKIKYLLRQNMLNFHAKKYQIDNFLKSNILNFRANRIFSSKYFESPIFLSETTLSQIGMVHCRQWILRKIFLLWHESSVGPLSETKIAFWWRFFHCDLPCIFRIVLHYPNFWSHVGWSILWKIQVCIIIFHGVIK